MTLDGLPDHAAAVIDMYRRTESIYKTAAALRCSKSHVYSVLRIYGEPMAHPATGPQRDDSRTVAYWEAWQVPGATYTTVGAQFGVTREAVRRSIMHSHRPWEIKLAKGRKQAHARLVRAAARHRDRVERALVCAVCGGLVLPPPKGGNRPGERASHRGECRETYLSLRYQCFDDSRVSIQTAIARAILAGRSEGSQTWARHYLDGETGDIGSRGRWLTEGSGRWKYALLAYRKRWPIFDLLPGDIRRAVIDRAEMNVTPRRDTPVS